MTGMGSTAYAIGTDVRVYVGLLEGLEGRIEQVIPRELGDYAEQLVIRVTKRPTTAILARLGDLVTMPAHDVQPVEKS